MRLKFDADTRDFTRGLDDLERKQLPKATAIALTEVAKDATLELRQQAEKDLDNPNRFTVRPGVRGRAPDAFAFVAAEKRDDPPTATVLVKDQQAEYLKYQIEGGTRRPGDYATVGKAGAPIPIRQRTNKYGNMPRNRLRTLFGQANEEDSDKFVGQPDGNPDAPFGIYQRPKGRRRGLKLLVTFEKLTRYRPRFDFQAAVGKAAQANMRTRFGEALEKALESARRKRQG